MIHSIAPSFASTLKKRLPAFAAGMWMFFCLLSPVFGEEPKLTDIIVTNTQENLLIYLTVEGAFTDSMKEAVMNGAKLEFLFYIKLLKTRGYWYDKSMVDLTETHTIQYDSEKKAFHVTRSWEPDAHVVNSFIEASHIMCEIDSLNIIPLLALKKGAQYQLRTKAELSRRTLPFYLHNILFFMSFWDFQTDWYAIDFTY
jgi:hypothetical protein